MDVLDHTIRDPRAAVKALEAPVLCTIPPSSHAELAGLARPGSALDAAYRALATTSVATDQLPRAIVVTAPVGDVQDNVAANFAAALAGLGLEVALVATKPRQSWFADSVGVENVATLSDLLTVSVGGRLNGQIRERLAPSRLAHLAVLGAGPLQADDLLEGLPSVLEGLAAAGIDVTVIAGPALLEDPAATILAWSTRSVLWVVEAGEVTDQEAREAAARLELAGAAPFGVAMVAATG
jgi:Mrp family chromosome partitioning ATPase